MIYDSEPNAGGLFYYPGCGLEPLHPELWEGCVLATLGLQERGNKARDWCGRDNHGPLTGATHLPTWGNQSYRGQSFLSLTCDGTEDCVTIPDAEGLRFGNATVDYPFTVSGWMRVTSIAANGEVLLSKSGTTSISCDYDFTWGSDSNFYAILYDNNGANRTYSGTTGSPLVLSAWTHVAITYSGGASAGITIWINGSQPAQSRGTIGTYVAMHGAAQSQRIGAFIPADAAKEFLAGSIASVFAWRRVLSAAEISTLALHPLEAYKVLLPEYYTSTAAAPTGNRRRRLLIAGARR